MHRLKRRQETNAMTPHDCDDTGHDSDDTQLATYLVQTSKTMKPSTKLKLKLQLARCVCMLYVYILYIYY